MAAASSAGSGMMHDNSARDRWFLLFFAEIISFLTSGVVFGWPSLIPMLQGDGVFLDQCSKDAPDCDRRKLRFAAVFSAGFFAMLASRLLFGLVLDWRGPRCTAMVGASLLMVGSIAMALQSSFVWLCVGFGLLGFGGPAIHIASFHISNLFEDRKRTVIASFSGVYSASGLVFLLLREVQLAAHMSRQAILLVYATVCGICILLIGLLQTKRPLRASQRVHFFRGLLIQVQDGGNTGKHKAAANEILPPLYKLTVARQLVAPPAAGLCAFLSATFLCIQFFLGNVRDILEEVNSGDKVEDYYVRIFQVVGALGGLALPVVGFLLDRVGFVGAFASVVGCGISFLTLTMVPVLELQLLTFCFWSVGRFFLFSSYFAMLRYFVGDRSFGTVNGVFSLVAALAATANYPLTAAALNVGFQSVAGGLLGLCFATAAYPFYLWMWGLPMLRSLPNTDVTVPTTTDKGTNTMINTA